MVDPSRTVFLSYRREVSWALAQAVHSDLAQHGFDVFMDIHGIDSGEFERVLLREIERRAHFLVLLEPHSLDRIGEEGDWLRREVAHALAQGRNIVPVTAGGARMPSAADLPADICRLATFNAVSVPPEYLLEAMQKLRDRFLGPAHQGDARSGWTQLVPRGAPVLTASLKTIRPRLSWTPVVGAAAAYEVAQSRTPDFRRAVVTASGPVLTHRLRKSTLTDGAWFRVRAADAAPAQPWSAAVGVYCRWSFLGTVSDGLSLSITLGPNGVHLAWTAFSGETAPEFVVECSRNVGFHAPEPIVLQTVAGADHMPRVSGPTFYRVSKRRPDGSFVRSAVLAAQFDGL